MLYYSNILLEIVNVRVNKYWYEFPFNHLCQKRRHYMKIEHDKSTLTFLAISGGTIAFGIILWILLPQRAVGIGFCFGGLILLISGLYMLTKPRTEILVDERVARINEKAGYYAFWLVTLFITILFLLNVVGSFTFEFKDVYLIVLCVGIYSWGIFRWWFNKRGEKI